MAAKRPKRLLKDPMKVLNDEANVTVIRPDDITQAFTPARRNSPISSITGPPRKAPPSMSGAWVTEATSTGETLAGEQIVGTDSVNMVGKGQTRRWRT